MAMRRIIETKYRLFRIAHTETLNPLQTAQLELIHICPCCQSSIRCPSSQSTGIFPLLCCLNDLSKCHLAGDAFMGMDQTPVELYRKREPIVSMKKTRVLKSWSKRNLPEELWPEILSRLPVKSLFRFRCVSRSWKVLIDDPDFARLHLNNFKKCHESNLFFVQGGSCECVVKNHKTLRTSFSLGFLQSDLESVNVLRTTPARSGAIRRWSIVSSIDGLFMLQSKQGSDLMLWNPSIRKTLTLPPPPDPPLNAQNVNFGLGFDPLINDYKFVRFGLIPKSGIQLVAVYTLGTNSWKEVEYQGEGRQDLIFRCRQTSISLNGVVYSVATDQNLSLKKLVSFDLRSEVFASSELPVSGQPGWCRHSLTVVDDGCSLAVVIVSESNGFIWVLERLGDDTKAWTWIRRYTFVTVPIYELYDFEFLCLKKNGEMLMKCYNTVICYNLETQQKKILLEKNKKNFQVGNTVAYMESLILHCYADQ